MHHFALFFVIIAVGFFVTAQTYLATKMQRESLERSEYDCLVAAVNATVEVVFTGTDHTVTKAGLAQAEEVFFQTLAVLREGATDKAAWMALREYIPCLVVFEERGYYRYCFEPEEGYRWTELVPYEDGQVPCVFFAETELLLQQYHNLRYQSQKKYRMEQAEQGIWEKSIAPPCVFAVYAPQSTSLPVDSVEFLYAATGRGYEAYYVTADNYCHLSVCKRLETEEIVARYATQRKSAEDGALPCDDCLK